MAFKLKASVAALAAIGFGACIGSAVAAPVVGAGASAIRNTAEGVVASYCANAASLTKFTGTNTNVTRLFCSSTTGATGLGTNFDFTYDSNGGSWRSMTVPFPALTAQVTGTANGLSSAATTGCTGTTSATIGSVAGVTVLTGCPLITLATLGTTITAIGFSDVEPDMFLSAANQPTGVTWGLNTSRTNVGTLTSFTGPVLGVVFGVGVSKPMYTALQSDQMASGLIPSTCVVGASLADAVCAPQITRQKYRSIVQNASTAGGGALQFDDTYLFDGTRATGTAIALARRDLGSGTQAGSNATFLGIGCAGAAALADLQANPTASGATETVTINNSTGAVITQVSGAAGDAIGIISRENSPSASGTWGFLKLDGVYPSSQSAITGKYDYFTEEFLYCRSGASAEEAKLCTDIQGSALQTAAAGVPLFVNTGGAFSLNTLFTGWPAVPTNGSYYRTLGNTCGKSFAQ